MDGPVRQASWKIKSDTLLSQGECMIVWPLSLQVCSQRLVSSTLWAPGTRLASLIAGEQRLFLPKQRAGRFRLQLQTHAEWLRLVAEPEDLWLASEHVRRNQGWEARLEPLTHSILVFNRSREIMQLRATTKIEGLTVEPSQVDLVPGATVSLAVFGPQCSPQEGEIELRAGDYLRLVQVKVLPALAGVSLRVEPRKFQLSPGEKVVLQIGVQAEAKGMLRLDTHPKPKFFPVQNGEWKKDLTLTCDDLPPLRKGKLRMSLFLDHPTLNYQACHVRLDFERPVLERQFPCLRLSPSHPQGQVSFWRSDGASVRLEARVAEEPGLEVEARNQEVLVRLTGQTARAVTICVKDLDSGLRTYLPVFVEL